MDGLNVTKWSILRHIKLERASKVVEIIKEETLAEIEATIRNSSINTKTEN